MKDHNGEASLEENVVELLRKKGPMTAREMAEEFSTRQYDYGDEPIADMVNLIEMRLAGFCGVVSDPQDRYHLTDR